MDTEMDGYPFHDTRRLPASLAQTPTCLPPPPLAPLMFLPFDEALAFAQSLGLANAGAWQAWCKVEGMRPPNMPARPDITYKGSGWQGWGHWLGTGNQSSKAKKAQFLPFDEALRVARALQLASHAEWLAWCKSGVRPCNVPSHPDEVYGHGGWIGWADWLGSSNHMTKQIRPFFEALTYARFLGLASKKEWRAWCKVEGMRHPNVPANPERTYKEDGWQGWGHWLGTGNVQNGNGKKFLPFGAALAVAQSLGLASSTEWRAWSKKGLRPSNVPARPEQAYKNSGWIGYVHWLGNDTKQFRPFFEALTYARSLNLASSTAWHAWSKEGKRPPTVPAAPEKAYKEDGWQGWGHWLGTGSQSKKAKGDKFLPFGEARRVARQLRFVSQTEWRLWCRSGARPANVPAAPDEVYGHGGWQGWCHWLGAAGLDAATASAVAPATNKRTARGGAGTPGQSRGKRRRR